MSWFCPRPSKWEIRALVTISAQIEAVESKLNLLLKLNGRDQELKKLSEKLKVSTDALAASVEAAKKTTKEE